MHHTFVVTVDLSLSRHLTLLKHLCYNISSIYALIFTMKCETHRTMWTLYAIVAQLNSLFSHIARGIGFSSFIILVELCFFSSIFTQFWGFIKTWLIQIWVFNRLTKTSLLQHLNTLQHIEQIKNTDHLVEKITKEFIEVMTARTPT